MSRPVYTKEQREQKRSERLALLDRAVEELTSSEAWASWLKVRRSFHHYSWRNQLMITIQRPTTLAVSGFRKWQERGRRVRKGSKAIWILAPTPFKTGKLDDRGEPERKLYFKPVPVFAYEDTDQIEGAPVCQIEPPLEDVSGDNLGPELERLDAWLVARGVTVEYEAIADAGRGYFEPGRNRIVIDLLPLNGQLKTLIHEAAHYLRHSAGDLHDYATEEVIVESTAYAVCATYGLETAAYSAGYVANWSEQGPKPADLVAVVDELATTIEEAIDGQPNRRNDRGRERGGQDDQPVPQRADSGDSLLVEPTGARPDRAGTRNR